MKLLRYGEIGKEKPGCLDDQGVIRDLSHLFPDLSGEHLHPDKLKYLQKIDLTTLPEIKNNPRIGACVGHVGKFICIGLNYADHAKETDAKIPAEPIMFMKATSSICGPYDATIIPRKSKKTDWEVELGIVIGKKAKYVPEVDALDYVAGYCVINDLSEREFQLERGGQWDKGKGCDTFGPIGPWLVTPDEVADPQQLILWLTVDDVRHQNGTTQNMAFGVEKLVSYLSEFFTLHPGDIISTGTPAGVGLGQKPEPFYLKAGQLVKLGITGLGEQEHLMVAE
jgi:2-keto-4-pentenoate hydratase/2-oxohepta-3-ene-1,7-dioic acid hydratase in catechol pathway